VCVEITLNIRFLSFNGQEEKNEPKSAGLNLMAEKIQKRVFCKLFCTLYQNSVNFAFKSPKTAEIQNRGMHSWQDRLN